MTTLEHSDNEDNEQEVYLSLQDIAEKNVITNAEHLFEQLFNSPSASRSTHLSSTDQLGGHHSARRATMHTSTQGVDLNKPPSKHKFVKT